MSTSQIDNNQVTPFADLVAGARFTGAIANDVVMVWEAFPHQDLQLPSLLRSVLSAEEKKRADAFVFEQDRRRFTLTHGLLRYILSGYCEHSPSDISFAVSEFGKPRMLGGVSFNMSHAGDGGLIAVSAQGPVGVDVEKVRTIPTASSLVERFFSHEEKRDFEVLPRERRDEGFLSIWTRKEAYIKALGGGLSLDLDGFAVSADMPARVLRTLPGDSIDWRLYDLRPQESHIGAVIVPSSVAHVIRVTVEF